MFCYTAVAVDAVAALLLPAAVVRRMPEVRVCCWFIESDECFFQSFIQTCFFFNGRTPWQYYCVVFRSGTNDVKII